MANKPNKNKSIASSQREIADFNYNDFKFRNSNKLLILSIVFFCLLLISLFKNISYPLFWADESMTAIGTERVIKYGYPKVHNEKNVFYDLRHSNPKLGINEKDDAYVGGTGWGHYYYGIIGYKLAQTTNDIYLKTGLYRTTFVIAGLFGLFLLGFLLSRFFPDKFSRYAFISLFLLLGITSVSLSLLLREVRYYSLVLLLCNLILGLYLSYRFYKPFNKIIFISAMALSLWLIFNTFAPVYFIIILSIGISELVIGVFRLQKSNLKTVATEMWPVTFSLIISLIAVYPLFTYFKTFEIAEAMNQFNNYSSKMYWDNVSTVFGYFKNFELLWLAIVLKIFIVFDSKKLLKEKNAQFQVSTFFTLFFIVYVFTIAKIPNFIFTRYIIYLQPILSGIILLDFFILLKKNSLNSKQLIPIKMWIPILIFIGLVSGNINNNFKIIKEHIYELTHQYKGPLDYTIPYIKDKFPESDSLIIAANYEETSYMYYLKCKVIIGYTGNNLGKDSIIQPDIIAYRKSWGNYGSIFQRFVQSSYYQPIKFPTKDIPVNNIPELNFMPAFNHKFKTINALEDNEANYLYIRNK